MKTGIFDNYSAAELNIIWLDSFDFLSYNNKAQLITMFGDKSDIRKRLGEYNDKYNNIVNETNFGKLKMLSDDRYLEDLLKSYNEKNVKLVTIFSDKYPEKLLYITNPPFILYCMGNLSLLEGKSLAVVGTRKPSDYGKIVTKMFVKELSQERLTIISGLAYGVDTIAHEETLKNGGKTIAVLAGGFDHIYPAANANLAKRIVEKGLLICENKPSTVGVAYMFPIRNRILAGLSDGVLITEAQENSGTIHTKNYAVEFGKELFIIPGKITSLESKGCNKILLEMQGAICLKPEQILKELNIVSVKTEKVDNVQLNFEEGTLLNFIRTDKKSYQELIELTKLTPQRLNAILMSMEVRGIIERLEGNCFISN